MLVDALGVKKSRFVNFSFVELLLPRSFSALWLIFLWRVTYQVWFLNSQELGNATPNTFATQVHSLIAADRGDLDIP